MKFTTKNEGGSVCDFHGVKPEPPEPGEKIGIALETIGLSPINGLRHKPENGTCGWYIWCGENMSDADDFFQPLCVDHIEKYIPDIKEYLDLPPGFRFLVDEPNWEDSWFDKELLNA